MALIQTLGEKAIHGREGLSRGAPWTEKASVNVISRVPS